MAPELKAKKRKGATDASPSSKKLKKADPAADKPGVAKAVDAIPENSVNPVAVKAKASRKRAADYLEEDAAPEGGVSLKETTKEPATSKKTKKAKVNGAAEVDEEPKDKSKKGKKSSGDAQPSAAAVVEKRGKAGKKTKAEPAPEPEKEEEEEEGDAQEEASGDEEIDDQTAALLKGFESSDDEADLEEDEKAIDQIPSIPNEKKLRKKLDKAAQENDEPGVIYVGRIPHGFYEHQMRAYFAQFGDITRLRLSRSAKTGRSRHFAFVEFASSEVAAIVAKAMDKYLLFGHILQIRTIPKEQVHEELFKGSNKRFKAIPRAKIEGRKLRLPKSKDEWEKKTKKEEGRRKKKLDKLKEIGYEFEVPQLKTIGDLDNATKAIEAPAEEPKKLLADKAQEEEQTPTTSETAKKTKKSKATATTPTKDGKPEKPKRAAARESLGATKSPKVKKAKKAA